jgi:hypothetical protein
MKGYVMNFMKWIQFSLALGPMVLQMIQAVEMAVGGGKGSQKTQLVQAAVMAAGQVVGANEAQNASLQESIPTLINATVAGLNAAGVFKPGTASSGAKK